MVGGVLGGMGVQGCVQGCPVDVHTPFLDLEANTPGPRDRQQTSNPEVNTPRGQND